MYHGRSTMNELQCLMQDEVGRVNERNVPIGNLVRAITMAKTTDEIRKLRLFLNI